MKQTDLLVKFFQISMDELIENNLQNIREQRIIKLEKISSRFEKFFKIVTGILIFYGLLLPVVFFVLMIILQTY